MWTTKIYNFFCDAFRAPYRSAAWMVLLYVIASVIYNPGSSFNNWVMPDTDDYTRFLQVFAWLDGHSWFDLTIPQLNPQHPVAMHWARLPDLLIAAILSGLEFIRTFFKLKAFRTDMAMLTAFIVPCIMLMGIVHLVRLHARTLIAKTQANIAIYIVPLCLLLIFQFMPMRVDHHAYILCAAATAFFSLCNIALSIQPLRSAAVAAFAIALGLWNGAEIMPFLVFFCLSLTALMLVKRPDAFLTGAVFGISLLGFTALILPLARAPSDIFNLAYDSFSFFYVLIALGAATYFVFMYLATRVIRPKAIVAALALFAGLSALAIFLHFFPDFVLGPYSKVNPLLNTLFLPNIREAIPFIQSWMDMLANFALNPRAAAGSGLYYLMTRLFVPVVAVLACAFNILNPNVSRRRRLLLALFGFFSLGFTLLAFFWEVRVMTYAQLFSIPPFTWLMLRYLKDLSTRYTGRALYQWELITALSFTLFPVVMVPGIIGQNKFMPDMLFYLARGTDLACKDRSATINQIRLLSKDVATPLTIMAPMDYGPELMFFTKANFIAAPYHRNDNGIVDMVSFFRSRTDDYAARRIAKTDKIDYVIICKAAFSETTLSSAQVTNNFAYNASTKKVEAAYTTADLKSAPLGLRLAQGDTPKWLLPLPLIDDNDFLFFKVKKDALR